MSIDRLQAMADRLYPEDLEAVGMSSFSEKLVVSTQRTKVREALSTVRERLEEVEEAVQYLATRFGVEFKSKLESPYDLLHGVIMDSANVN